jgi:peroxiredoxin
MKKIILIACCIASIHCIKAQITVGAMAPEIVLPNAKGDKVSLSSFKGKVVLLDFWASWCGPCRASIPLVIKLQNKYKAQGFEVFGVSIDSKKNVWLKAIKKDHINYTQVIDLDGWNAAAAAAYNVDAIPATFLLDKTGKIVTINAEGKELEDAIKTLLTQ